MSVGQTASPKKDTGQALQKKDFVIAKISGKFFRLLNDSIQVAGAEIYTAANIKAMELEAISRLYSDIAGTTPKQFKNKGTALDSLNYQIEKLGLYDPAAAAAPKTAPAEKEKAESKKRKGPENFELVSPEKPDDALKGLAPQAKELISIMTDIAADSGSTKFLKSDLLARLKIPAVAERLHTKQDPARILQYYQGQLVTAGFLKTSQ